jgi:hypothetical protein
MQDNDDDWLAPVLVTNCPKCNAAIRVPEELFGRRVRCPCGARFTAPDRVDAERLRTVNVIEYVGGAVAQVIAFPDNKEGNKAAEVLFRAMAKESGFLEREIAVGLEEGRLENKRGTCQLFLVHSQT